jgi:hypothetical protein
VALSYSLVPFWLDHEYGTSDFMNIGRTRLIGTPSLSELIEVVGLGSNERRVRGRRDSPEGWGSGRRRRVCGSGVDESVDAKVPSDGGDADGLLLDEAKVLARSAWLRWSGARAIVRRSSARGQRGLVVDEYVDLGQTETNQHVRYNIPARRTTSG